MEDKTNKGEVNKMNRGFLIAGIGALITGYVLFLLTFFLAFFSSSKEVVVRINDVGEANFELFTILMLLPIVCITIFWIIKQVKNE